jgi:hypothetical protein
MNIIKRCEFFSNIELEHIKIEINYERLHHLRHFIDQYYCYNNGYVTKNCNPKWSDILWDKNVSNAAKIQINKQNVVKEHVVPINVIKSELQKLTPSCTLNDIKMVLDEFLIFATITKEEDNRLSKLGFKQKMPKAYYDMSDILYNDKFSRYKKAGIEILNK